MCCARRAMLEKRLENATVEVWQEFPYGTRVTHAAFINRDLPEFFRAYLVHADGGMLAGVAALADWPRHALCGLPGSI